MLHKTIKFVIASNIQLVKCFYIQLIKQPKVFTIYCSTKNLLDFLVQRLLLLAHGHQLNLHP
jgi:hypothetical protein